jgi:hypothetical protein
MRVRQNHRPGRARVLAVLFLALAGLGLRACDDAAEAPTNPGYCWRVTKDGTGKVGFSPVSSGVNNLESCAAALEAVSMRERRPDFTGAYQGQFIFITPDMVQSGLHLAGARYRLFDAETRAKIDRNLTWMLEDERRPSRFAPRAGRPVQGDPAALARERARTGAAASTPDAR